MTNFTRYAIKLLFTSQASSARLHGNPSQKQHRSLDRSSDFPPPRPKKTNPVAFRPPYPRPGCPVRFSPSRLVSHSRHRLSAEISPCGKAFREETVGRSTSAYEYCCSHHLVTLAPSKHFGMCH